MIRVLILLAFIVVCIYFGGTAVREFMSTLRLNLP